jgi:uncharacterized cupin superfamily protein
LPTERIAPLKPISSLDVPWQEWFEGPRFGVRERHLSSAAMGQNYRLGVVIVELPPGRQSYPAHYHILEEEHVYILEGSLTLRLGADAYAMKAGDYVCFPAGQRAGHCLINNSGATCRYLLVGERNPNEVAVYTDSKKVLVRALGPRAILDLAAARAYWEGEDTGQTNGQVARPDVLADALTVPVKPKPPISSGDVAWDETHHTPGFVDRNKHLTYAAVGKDYHVGTLIEGPPPGTRQSPKHYHMLEEEHALILEGQLTLLLGDERHEMKVGDYICFPAGQKIGHSFLNSGTGPCSYLMIGESNPGDVCVMPDSNKMQVRALQTKASIFDMSGTRKYLDGEHAG